MRSTALVFLIGLPLAAIAGPAAVRASAGLRTKAALVPEALEERFGRAGGLVLSAAGAIAGFMVLGIIAGFLVSLLTGPVDEPALRWQIAQYRLPNHLLGVNWLHWNNTLTKMGNTIPSRQLVVVASVVLAALWWRRRFWIPPVVIAGTYLVAWTSQHLFVSIVARTPPTGTPIPTLGTWPSGGCMRIVSLWGIIALLLVRTFPKAPRWFATALAVLVSVAAWTEAYTRVYLVKHWVTDVVGGLFMGVVLLVLAATVTEAWIGQPTTDSVPEPDTADPVAV